MGVITYTLKAIRKKSPQYVRDSYVSTTDYATYSSKKAIIKANNPVASEKANPKIA